MRTKAYQRQSVIKHDAQASCRREGLVLVQWTFMTRTVTKPKFCLKLLTFAKFFFPEVKPGNGYY